MKYDAVVFDLFGTLVSFSTGEEYRVVLDKMADILQVTPENFSKTWFDTYVERFVGKFASTADNLAQVCQTLGATPSDGDIKQAESVRLEFTRNSLKPVSDVPDSINKLKSGGHKIGLISDCSIEVPTLWPETEFPDLIDEPVFSCSVKIKKPDPRIYMLACERLEVAPKKCLYVGDGGSQELTGALNVGMHPVLIRNKRWEEMETYSYDKQDWDGDVISSISEVLDLV